MESLLNPRESSSMDFASINQYRLVLLISIPMFPLPLLTCAIGVVKGS